MKYSLHSGVCVSVCVLVCVCQVRVWLGQCGWVGQHVCVYQCWWQGRCVGGWIALGVPKTLMLE